ncbi:hypothetical protein [Arthrobacter sp. R4-81]
MKQDLQIRQVWPASDGRAVLSPFDASEDFTQECWQADEVIAASAADSFYSFLRAGTEVARMLLVDPAGPIDGYDVPQDLADAIHIDFIEVAGGYRGQGFGSRAVELVQQLFPGRTFVALPGGNEGFWESLGWLRYEHRQGGAHPPLFVSR